MRKRIFGLLILLIGMLSGCGEQQGVLIRGGQSREETDVTNAAAETDLSSAANATSVAATEDTVAAKQENGGTEYVCVYLCGAVMQPGIYEVEEGTRIYEIIDLAGGFAENADETCLNLAEVVTDGIMIRVYYEGESRSDPGNGTYSVYGNTGKVNLNTAGLTELMSLPGIGETKASEIMEYRERNGFFRSTEEIMNVPGIKEGLYERIKAYVTV